MNMLQVILLVHATKTTATSVQCHQTQFMDSILDKQVHGLSVLYCREFMCYNELEITLASPFCPYHYIIANDNHQMHSIWYLHTAYIAYAYILSVLYHTQLSLLEHLISPTVDYTTSFIVDTKTRCTYILYMCMYS